MGFHIPASYGWMEIFGGVCYFIVFTTMLVVEYKHRQRKKKKDGNA